jgi:hypothetical protein
VLAGLITAMCLRSCESLRGGDMPLARIGLCLTSASGINDSGQLAAHFVPTRS